MIIKNKFMLVLLIVITSILSLIALIAIKVYEVTAPELQRLSAVSWLASSVYVELDQYYNEHGHYPAELAELPIPFPGDGASPEMLNDFEYETDGTYCKVTYEPKVGTKQYFQKGTPKLKQEGAKKMDIKVTSPAFAEGEFIPAEFTADGRNISPPIAWTPGPEGTKSIALINDDPDAPMGTWVHWVVYNLPADATSLDENVLPEETLPNGAMQGTTDFGQIGYGGPAPPSGTHRYFFKVYALDTMLDLPTGATKSQVESAMNGHILAQGQLMGKYSRK